MQTKKIINYNNISLNKRQETTKKKQKVCNEWSDKIAFTLAEVLITITIIGIVAALTIPTIVSYMNSKVYEYRQKVFNTKLIQGLNLAKTAGDLDKGYNSTEDFLRNGLARHYKMSSICGKNNLHDCIPYDEIIYMDGNKEKSVKVVDLKTAKSIKIDKEGFDDTAAFITADGIPVIITYDKTCTVDTEKIDQGISSCVAGIYDINGTKKPNKYAFILNDDGETIKAYTYDIRTFNGAGIGSTSLFDFEIAIKYFNPIENTIYTSVGSPTFDADWCGGTTCPDHYLAAKAYCEMNNAHLPSVEQLNQIADVLYNSKNWYYGNTNSWNANKEPVFEALGIDTNSNYVGLWADSRGFGAYYENYSNIDAKPAIFPDTGNAICVK